MALSSGQALNVDPQEELIKKYLTYGSPPLQAEPGPSDQSQPQQEESQLLVMHAARPARAVRSAAPLPSVPQETDLFTPHASGIARPASLPGDYILQSQGSVKGTNEEDQVDLSVDQKVRPLSFLHYLVDCCQLFCTILLINVVLSHNASSSVQHAQLRSRMEAVEAKLQERQSVFLYTQQHEQIRPVTTEKGQGNIATSMKLVSASS